METNKKSPALDHNQELQDDKTNGETTTGEDLKYNADDDSFELDTQTEDQEYQHPLPYDTSAPSGRDDNSSYDEENIYTQNEYFQSGGVSDAQIEETETDRIVGGFELEERDEKLTHVNESRPSNEDQEGYPKKDDTGGKNNPIE